MDGDIDELRRDPTGIEHLGIEEIVDYYAGIIGELDSPPIIMGHSFGGAFTQILLDRGLGAGLVGAFVHHRPLYAERRASRASTRCA